MGLAEIGMDDKRDVSEGPQGFKRGIVVFAIVRPQGACPVSTIAPTALLAAAVGEIAIRHDEDSGGMRQAEREQSRF